MVSKEEPAAAQISRREGSAAKSSHGIGFTRQKKFVNKVFAGGSRKREPARAFPALFGGKIFFAYAASGQVSRRDILPQGAGSDAVIGIARFLVVDIAADRANILHDIVLLNFIIWRFRARISENSRLTPSRLRQ